MFSTFTGNSRRPRTVNLSGQAGNRFTNASWSPSTASNATKTVSDAQADREKRQAERLRFRAVQQIQRTWRGHRVRQQTYDAQRRAIDNLYQSESSMTDDNRLALSFTLLRSFYTARRPEDRTRLLRFITDCRHYGLADSPPFQATARQSAQFYQMVLDALNTGLEDNDSSRHTFDLLDLATQILSTVQDIAFVSVGNYYEALAKLCRSSGTFDKPMTKILVEAFTRPLKLESNKDFATVVYDSIAFSFLTRHQLVFFETHISLFGEHIELEKLAASILNGYGKTLPPSNEDLLWLLSHFLGLSDVAHDVMHSETYLEALYTQLMALSKDISLHLGGSASSNPELESSDEEATSSCMDSFVKRQLLSLVSPDAISKLLQNLPSALDESFSDGFEKASLLAGYLSTLLACFPSRADEIRMRLFLASVPGPDGEVTTVQLFWRFVRQSALFQKLCDQSRSSEDVLRDYVQGSFHPFKTTPEDQQWRVTIIFLELYIFVLRLSDDEDFLSGIKSSFVLSSSPASRIQSSSLSLGDLKLLTSALKNSAFALHYKSQSISEPRNDVKASARLGAYLGSTSSNSTVVKPRMAVAGNVPNLSTKLDIESLRDLISTAMKMLYERDSRKHFLPPGHWLMTDQLDKEDFVSAVIAEDERQRQEEDGDGSETEDEDAETPEPRLARFGVGFPRNAFNVGTQRIRHNQRKIARERRLAEMGPKLEILKHMPFIVPFETRVKIFRQFIDLDRYRRDADSPRTLHRRMEDMIGMNARHQANIRRGRVFEDAYDNFYKLGDGLKDSINITFVDQFGSQEAGIDGGGVTKEFLTSVTKEAFGGADDSLRMFTSSDAGLLYPNPIAVDNSREALRRQGLTETDAEWKDLMSALLKRYEFLGRIVGKCLYEGILVDLAFAGFFLLQWPSAGSAEGNTYKGSVNDLSDLDEDLYKGMLRLKNYSGDVAALGIDFTITDQVSLPHEPPKTITRNLIPNGDKMTVTNDNRLLYISYVARHRLVLQPALQTAAFLRGLRDIIRPSWLSMFNQSELQHLVGGDSSEIDIEDLRRNTVYGGLYEIGDDGEEHPTVKLFWKVMKTFDDGQRRDVLKYVSSTPRAPLLGFSQLRPKFSIRDAGTNEQRLPSTSTCVNLLKLPQYRSEAGLRAKLLYAITSGAGFDLS